MKVGLIGTGYWAQEVHAAAVRAEPDMELAGIWGRNGQKARVVAEEVGTRAYEEVDRLFQQVDALTFAVPPSVQADIAVRAAGEGKHLLLEKPIALSPEQASRMADAVADAGVASIVFFTHRFIASQRRWLEQVSETGGWQHAWAMWLGAAFVPGSPFDTPWRHEKGPLWDVGPHALAILCGALGPVSGVTAVPGPQDLVHLTLEHEGGATSNASLTLMATAQNERTGVSLWGPTGFSDMPESDTQPVDALRTALRELRDQAASPAPSHPCDIRFGKVVVEVLAEAEHQLAAHRLRA